jgi:hypothetical protein
MVHKGTMLIWLTYILKGAPSIRTGGGAVSCQTTPTCPKGAFLGYCFVNHWVSNELGCLSLGAKSGKQAECDGQGNQN